MSDKNIDKDIEILKELVEHNYLEDINYLREPDEEHKKFNQAIENVLSELENLQDDLRIHEETSFDFQKENIELREEIKELKADLKERHIKHIALAIENEDLDKELETYKKIAEKLAIEVENLDDMLSAELGSHTRGYCKIENSCILNHKRKCSECIIDWARKEVENGKNNNR